MVKTINWIYEFATMYGNSPERSCALALVLMLYNGVLVVLNGLYVVNVDCGTKIAESWIGGLCGDGIEVMVSAALMIGFQPLFDPIGPFREQQIVLPSALWLTWWLWASQLAVLALLAVAAFGVRRRLQY